MQAKHRLSIDQMPMAANAIQFGSGMIDRENHAIFFYEDRVVFQCIFQATIKAVMAKDELWLASFHKVSHQEVRRMMKKSEAVQTPT